jgi:predicted Zn-dependent protease
MRKTLNSLTEDDQEETMETERIRQFQELIALEPDDTVLRFGLGELYIGAEDFASAAEQFAEIVRLDPQYSAAYRYLGQSYAALGKPQAAAEVFQRGIAVAEARGDLQTAKEMQVFLRRLQKQAP